MNYNNWFLYLMEACSIILFPLIYPCLFYHLQNHKYQSTKSEQYYLLSLSVSLRHSEINT